MRKRFITGLATAIVALSCATPNTLLPPVSMDFFVPVGDDNPWHQKIQNWQARHHLDMLPQAEPRKPSPLAGSYAEFESDLRRRIAAETISWVQNQSRRYYRPDGERDHWATLGEVIETGGDDCDGLDLLTFVTLRRLGFPRDAIYRSIVVDQRTGQHHMVTLWFDSPERTDPWVLDPTGVVTPEMVRLSDVPAWEPIELFDESSHFRAEPHDQIALSMAD